MVGALAVLALFQLWLVPVLFAKLPPELDGLARGRRLMTVIVVTLGVVAVVQTSRVSTFMGDSALAADATQLAFITVLRKAGKFKFQSAFSSWLYRVAVNCCIDLKRKRARTHSLSMTDPDVAMLADGGDYRRPETPGPEEYARQGELVQEVSKAISRLNPRLSVVVVLRYLEGLGYEEIAEILEMPLGTVKSRLNRAHAALEQDLGPRLDSLS